MFIDARSDDGPKHIEADLCIIGAGAAGITIARQFIGSRHKVVLLESGGFEFDPETQALYEGGSTGLPYFPLDATRLRYFGGTTNHWTGWCRPLDEIDFEERNWVPDSGWPISKSDLRIHYERAAAVLELRGHDFEPRLLIDRLRETELDATKLRPDLLRVNMFRMSPPTRMGEKYQDEIRQARNVTCLVYTNAIDMDTAEQARHVTSLACQTIGGKQISVRARNYVLALGGIENPRFLLNSNRIEKDGLGNRNGLVGRYFGEHIEMALGIIALPTSLQPLRPFLKQIGNLQLSISLAPNAQREKRLLNANATFNEIRSVGEATLGFGAMRRILRAAQRRELPDSLWDDIKYMISDADEIGRYLWSRATGRKEDSVCVIMNRCETAPNRESRVALSDEKDRFGKRKVNVEWRLSDLERRTIHHYQRTLGEEFGRLGIGRVRIGLEERGDNWPPNLDGGHHHMGTTRMHDDAKKGVVDRNCRVHGIENLYVAGSSVFPTFGNANPTLTIVALALRLSDQLMRNM